MTALTHIRRATAVAIALGLGSLGLAGAAQAEDTTSALSADSNTGSLQAFHAVVQADDVAEEIPGAEDMPVDRGVVILPVNEMNDEMYAGELNATADAKAFVQVGGSAGIGSEAGELR